MIPPPASWPKAGRCSTKMIVAAATASPLEVLKPEWGEAPQVGG